MDYYDPRRRALRAVRQLLYPRECPFCGRVLGDVRDCPDCAEQLEVLRRKPGIRLACIWTCRRPLSCGTSW